MGRKKQQQDNYWDEDFEEDMEALQREADAAEGANSTTEKESGEDVADESGGVIAEEDNIVVIEDVEDGKYSTDEEGNYRILTVIIARFYWDGGYYYKYHYDKW